MPRLLKLDEAADELGVPCASLRTAAEEHGYLVRMGRAIRIDRETLPELIDLCRDHPRERDSSASATASGTSATDQAIRVDTHARPPTKLIGLSRGTSPSQGPAHRPKCSRSR